MVAAEVDAAKAFAARLAVEAAHIRRRPRQLRAAHHVRAEVPPRVNLLGSKPAGELRAHISLVPEHLLVPPVRREAARVELVQDLDLGGVRVSSDGG